MGISRGRCTAAVSRTRLVERIDDPREREATAGYLTATLASALKLKSHTSDTTHA